MPELLTPLILADGFSTVRGLLGVVLGVGMLIFIHELGHFLAAKWAGVRVEVFSLGFGHRLLGFRRGGTDYRLSLLPLGGYVKMLGQADDDPVQAPTEREDDFRNKSVGKRFVILVAGVVMNLLLAAFGFVLAFGLGLEFDAPQVGSISAGSAASKADLRPGDVILSIDGREILGWQDVSALVALSNGPIELKVLRDGKTHQTTARPYRAPGETYARLGILPGRVLGDFVGESSPLKTAGLRPASPTESDRILNVSPVDSRCDPNLEMPLDEWLRVVDDTQGAVAVSVERTQYDPVSHLPTGSKRLQAEVTFERKPVYTIGADLPDVAWIRGVRAGSAADRAGVQEGDRVRTLAGEEVTYTNLKDVVREVGASSEGPVELVVERTLPGGEAKQLRLQVTLELQNQAVLSMALEGVDDPQRAAEIRREVGNWLLGVEYRADVVAAPFDLPLADTDAEPVRLEPGDRLLSVWRSGGLWWNKELPWRGADVVTGELNRRKDEPFKLSWQRKGSDEVESAVVRAFPHPTRTYADLGAALSARQVIIERGPLGACSLGMAQTWIQTRRIVLTLRSFFTGSVSPRELGGPIQIMNVAYGVARENSLAQLLHLLAILSVNLAVINILPIPVLDGGHIFFLTIEKLKGRPVSGEVMIWAQWVGLGCILALMALVFFNDISRLGQ